jgi:hypothetical protein
LCGDTRSLTHAMIDSPVVARDSGSGFITTNAFGISPASSSGRRTTATSSTAGMRQQQRLELRGRHLQPFVFDQFLRAIDDVEPALFVDVADVAGVIPALRIDRCRGGIGVVQVTLHDVRAANQQLALGVNAADRFPGGRIHDLHFRVRHDPAD